MPDRSISRADLIELVDEASGRCAQSTRAKLLAVAATTDRVAAGWFHCDGVQCPSQQARRSNQKFQQAFDEAMFKRFGVDMDEVTAFVVEVIG